MKSKYELTISTNYVPDWTYIEAFRELFQNAIDNELVNPENKMGFNFSKEEGTIRVSNSTSVLRLETLLLGSTTKADSKETIGKHGEGYKIAFMVLLREGKTIKVYNYGEREIWTARLVKSRRFNGELIPTIEVEKSAFWSKVPDNDLTIEVGNITEEEYTAIQKKNLHLQEGVKRYDVPRFGGILTHISERGNVYVKGLFVCHMNSIRYGYDMEPSLIELDRDRRVVSDFNLTWETSAMWKYAYKEECMKEEFISMIKSDANDIKYIKNRSNLYYNEDSCVDDSIADELAEDFKNEYGEDSIPVCNNAEMVDVQNSNRRAVIVGGVAASFIRTSKRIQISIPEEEVDETKEVKEGLEELLYDIEDRLTDEEVERFKSLIGRIPLDK